MRDGVPDAALGRGPVRGAFEPFVPRWAARRRFETRRLRRRRGAGGGHPVVLAGT